MIIAMVMIFTAAYIIYDKYKSQFIIQPPIPNSLTNTDTNGKDGQDENTSDEDNQAGQATKENGETSDNVDNDVTMAPDFTLKDLDGNEVSLSDYKGKIVVLNFWATWCRYCIEEMPDFNELDKEMADAGDGVVLAVNVQEPYNKVNEYITNNDFGIKVLLDEDGYIAGAIYGVEGYPTTFVLNKDGSLYTYIPGKTDLDTMRTIIDMARENVPLE
jgi:peroxiredoxin